MKLNTLSLILAVAGLATSVFSANYEVRITGSTAGRSSVHTAIANILPGATITQDNANLGSANKANFVGAIGGDTVTVRCAWTGSAAGVQSLDENANVTFMDQTTGGTVTPTNLTAKADIAFSDVFQSSTVFNSLPLNDQMTIVLPFKFFTSEGSPVTNVTPAQAQYLFLNGAVPLSFFTGNVADFPRAMVATGRDNSSGTRITTMAEIGHGVFNNVTQYKPTTVGTNISLTGGATTNGSAVVTHSTAALVAGQGIRGPGIPANTRILTVNSATQFTMSANATATASGLALFAGLNAASQTLTAEDGNGGESSGGTVAANVAVSTSGLSVEGRSPAYYLGYLGVADGVTAATNGAIECTYNGVPYTPENVYNGRYSLWGYLHLMTRPDVAATADAFATNLVEALEPIPGASGVRLSLMRVSRPGDGALITSDF